MRLAIWAYLPSTYAASVKCSAGCLILTSSRILEEQIDISRGRARMIVASYDTTSNTPRTVERFYSKETTGVHAENECCALLLTTRRRVSYFPTCLSGILGYPWDECAIMARMLLEHAIEWGRLHIQRPVWLWTNASLNAA